MTAPLLRGGIRPLLFPGSVAVVGASDRTPDAAADLEQVAARRRADLVRQPEPAHRARPRVLPVADGPARDARVRVPPGRPHARRGGLRGRDRGRRARGRAARPRRRGRRRGASGRGAHRGARGRVRHRGRRPELHGRRDAGRPLALARDGRRARGSSCPGTSPASRTRARSPRRAWSPGPRVGFRTVVSAGRRALARSRRLRRLPRRRRRHEGDRAVRRDDPAPRGLRRGTGARRRGGQAGRVPQGRALAGRGARGARPLGRRGRLGARLLGAAAPSRRARGGRLPRAARDARGARPAALAARAAHRGRLGVGRRVRPARRPRRGGRHPVRAVRRRAQGAADRRVPELHAAREPARLLGDRRCRVVYPGSLALLRDTGDYDVLLAQVDLSRHRGDARRGVVLADRRVARRRRRGHGHLPGRDVGARDRPAAGDRRAGARDATWRCCAARARACARSPRSRAGTRAAPPAARTAHVRAAGDPLPAGALPEHDSCALLERYGVGFPPRERCASAGGGGGGLRAPRRAGRRQGRRAGAQGRRRAASRSASPSAGEARDAAERMGGRVLVARQVALRASRRSAA